jgi:hypothetical protein
MVWGFPAGWQVGLILNSLGTANYISCLKALCNAIGFGFLPIDCPQGDKRNRNTRKPFSQRNSGHHPKPKKHRTDALPHQHIPSQCALARTSTGERRPGGRTDWMFLIFLLLFGSSQKEGVRLPYQTVQSKKFRSPPQTKKSTGPTLSPINRPPPSVRWPEHPRGSRGHAGWPIGCS